MSNRSEPKARLRNTPTKNHGNQIDLLALEENARDDGLGIKFRWVDPYGALDHTPVQNPRSFSGVTRIATE